MTIYTFTINNLVYLEDLTEQLSLLNLLPDNLNYSLNILTLTYSTELTTIQFTNLNNFITGYIPIVELPDIFYTSYNMNIVKSKINDCCYRLAGTLHFIVPNNTILKSTNINFISFINSGNYQVRIYNFTTKTILKESVFLNKDRQVNIMNITVPTVDSIIEIHIKVDNNINSAIIESAQINLYN